MAADLRRPFAASGPPSRTGRPALTLALGAASPRRLAPFLALALLLALSATAARAAAPTGVLDSRAWELVSPLEKNGGEVASLGAGALQAAAQGGALAYASEASFGQGAGAAPLSQYLASRGEAGWGTANLTPPLLSGTYESDPYLLFSADLSRALLSGGWRCRAGGGEECEAENPPLGPGGPPGYRNIYLRQGTSYTPLITEADFPALPPEAKEFHLALQGASPDLDRVVFSVGSQLYLWSSGAIEALGSPGAALAAPGNARGAVSADGNRVYFTESGNLYLREGATAVQLDAAQGGGGEFQLAAQSGSPAFFLKAAHLYRYLPGSGATDLTPSGGVTAALAASADGQVIYYVAAGGIYRLKGASATKVVSAANLSHLPPATGPAAASADATSLFFTAADALLPLADSDGRPDAYQWEAQGAGTCRSAPGCLGLLSSGRSGEASFAAASADGTDAYFLTQTSLLPPDTGSTDLYDARAGGGYPEPQPGIECNGDDCQGPPYVPQDPAPASSVVSGPENPKPHYTANKRPPKQHHRNKKRNRHRRHGRGAKRGVRG